MSNNDNLYKILSPETLDDFGLKTFGKNPSSDFTQIKRLIKHDAKVLEIGVGAGRLALQLIDLNIHYTGLDKQSHYVSNTRKILKIKSIPKEKYTLLNTAFEDLKVKIFFDVILFSWTVIGDFNKKEQLFVLNKTFNYLNEDGICIIDNPSENQTYNKHIDYRPTNFYYKDWKNIFTKIGFSHKAKIYKTKTGIERELIILRKINVREGSK
jgi:predicted O-methyltransferase YrrM